MWCGACTLHKLLGMPPASDGRSAGAVVLSVGAVEAHVVAVEVTV